MFLLEFIRREIEKALEINSKDPEIERSILHMKFIEAQLLLQEQQQNEKRIQGDSRTA